MTHQVAPYTQYVCSWKVRRLTGCARSHSLMLSSQEPLKKRPLFTVFQLREYTCRKASRQLSEHAWGAVGSHDVMLLRCCSTDASQARICGRSGT